MLSEYVASGIYKELCAYSFTAERSAVDYITRIDARIIELILVVKKANEAITMMRILQGQSGKETGKGPRYFIGRFGIDDMLRDLSSRLKEPFN